MEVHELEQEVPIVVPAVATSVPYVRHAIVDAAATLGADAPTRRRIALAVSEAVTNAVLHAFGDQTGCVSASVERVGDELEVVVTDDGGGLAPRSDSPGLGMGLGIIADVTDRLSIASADGLGTRLHMWFTAAVRDAPRSVG
jgi:serine/threonine-protein kinase RsbW